MQRVLVAAAALALALGLFGCGQRPSVDTEAWTKRLQPAVLSVAGVTGGDVRMIASGPVSEPKIICNVTSAASARPELVATLERVLRRLVSETAELDDALVECTVTNGHDYARLGDLDAIGSLKLLRKRFG